MQCPVDQAQLVMTERQGVEIDYCPVCRGIWLDRGELDKMLDRAAGHVAADPRAVPGAASPGPPPGFDDRRDAGRPGCSAGSPPPHRPQAPRGGSGARR